MGVSQDKGLCILYTEIYSFDHYHKQTTPVYKYLSCRAEVHGWSFVLLSQARTLPAAPHPTLLSSPPFWPPPVCSALLRSVGSDVLHRYPQELQRRFWARIRCQEYFVALEIVLLPLLPILKSWHFFVSVLQHICCLSPFAARTQMLWVGLQAGMRWLTGKRSCSSLLLLQTLNRLLLPGGHLRFLGLWWELPLLLVFLIRDWLFIESVFQGWEKK